MLSIEPLHLIILLRAIALCTLGIVSYYYYLFWRLRDLRHAERMARQIPSEVLPYSEYKKRHLRSGRVRTIAILTTNQGRSTEEMKEEFIESIRDHGASSYHFTEYKSGIGRRKPAVVMEDIIKKPYELIFTIGIRATAAARHVTLSRNKIIPIVCAGVRDTWWHTAEEKQKTDHITGIIISGGWEMQVSYFLRAKPQMKAVLIFHSEFMQETLDALLLFFDRKEIVVSLVQPRTQQDVMDALSSHQDVIDSVISLRDPISTQSAQTVGQFCIDHEISFFTTDLASVDLGAVMGVSIHTAHMGELAAQKAIDILEHNKKSDTMHVNILPSKNSYEIRFNKESLEAQNIDPAIIETIALSDGKVVYAHR